MFKLMFLVVSLGCLWQSGVARYMVPSPPCNEACSVNNLRRLVDTIGSCQGGDYLQTVEVIVKLYQDQHNLQNVTSTDIDGNPNETLESQQSVYLRHLRLNNKERRLRLRERQLQLREKRLQLNHDDRDDNLIPM